MSGSKSDLSRVIIWQVLKYLFFFQRSSFGCVDDRIRKVTLSCRAFVITHKQVGLSLGQLFTPDRFSSIYSCRFGHWYTLSHGSLISRAPTLFGETLYLSRLCLWYLIYDNFLIWKNEEWRRMNENSWLLSLQNLIQLFLLDLCQQQTKKCHQVHWRREQSLLNGHGGKDWGVEEGCWRHNFGWYRKFRSSRIPDWFIQKIQVILIDSAGEASAEGENLTALLLQRSYKKERTKKPSLRTCRLWPTTLLKTCGTLWVDVSD